LYPGLAIARALVRLSSSVEPFFVGAHRGIERDVLPDAGFPHLLLDVHPLYRTRPWENWRTLRGAVRAWRALSALARQEVARLVVGTGGYAAAVTLAHAVAHGVPIVLQEQNSFPGLTQRMFSRRAREIYLGFPEAAASFAGRGARVTCDTGNPIEPPPTDPPPKADARRHWGFAPDGPVLLVVGGSQGAKALNDTVGQWVARGLPERVSVIWATGQRSFASYAHLANPRVRVEAYLSPIATAYAAADLVVSRAGAMTTAELCAWGLPAVLIPLPTAAADHQTANAHALERAGAAIVLAQAEASVERLDAIVRRLIGDPPALIRLASTARLRGRPRAADDIARRILALLGVRPDLS
jgi:UDP-N-acetylglucosamine--N-acetylmuramyl-(pentapeptide) pyrophosphoryl-undecaprenol N-acetylglucosamine transferase